MSGAEGPQFLDLDAGSEWRFELENDENIAVRVSSRISSFEETSLVRDVHVRVKVRNPFKTMLSS